MDFLRVFEAKALAAALTDAGYSVSERTVQRWKAGETRPKPQDVQAIRELVGVLSDTKETAPPEWAERLADMTAGKVIAALAPADFLEALDALRELLARIPPPDDASDAEEADAGAQGGAAPGVLGASLHRAPTE